MAKMKKIKTEELEALQAVLNAQKENEQKILSAIVGMRQLTSMKEEGLQGLEANQNALDKLSSEFREAYGDVNINAQTGEITEQESQVE